MQKVENIGYKTVNMIIGDEVFIIYFSLKRNRRISSQQSLNLSLLVLFAEVFLNTIVAPGFSQDIDFCLLQSVNESVCGCLTRAPPKSMILDSEVIIPHFKTSILNSSAQ